MMANRGLDTLLANTRKEKVERLLKYSRQPVVYDGFGLEVLLELCERRGITIPSIGPKPNLTIQDVKSIRQSLIILLEIADNAIVFPFLKLPKELQLEVYKLTLVSERDMC